MPIEPGLDGREPRGHGRGAGGAEQSRAEQVRAGRQRQSDFCSTVPEAVRARAAYLRGMSVGGVSQSEPWATHASENANANSLSFRRQSQIGSVHSTPASTATRPASEQPCLFFFFYRSCLQTTIACSTRLPSLALFECCVGMVSGTSPRPPAPHVTNTWPLWMSQPVTNL